MQILTANKYAHSPLALTPLTRGGVVQRGYGHAWSHLVTHVVTPLPPLTRGGVVERGYGHAPLALPADAPVAAPLRHARDAVDAGARHPGHLVDGGQGGGSEAVHAGKPLARGPAVRGARGGGGSHLLARLFK